MNNNVRRADWNRLLDETLSSILETVAGTDIEEVTVSSEQGSIRVQLQPDARAEDQAPAPTAEEIEAATAIEVVSRNVGIFRRGDRDGEEVAARIGSLVEAGQPIGFIDTLDHYHPVAATKAGELMGFFAEDAETVEYGQKVARIQPR